ncbi:Fic family protein [Microbacterium sp. MYb62]|uniref:Fic family protein n=1 Tax=Microbacterium sp. MYb62 TaxID=1848690 RepID=UPI00215719DD|nr:Fic family protein [Microbacterium sp. MYb62]
MEHTPDASGAVTAWPAHVVETRPWRQQFRSGTKADRMLSHVDAAIPPFIAALDYSPPLSLIGELETALMSITRADADAEGHSVAVSRFMIRSESVASSKIERIAASAEDYAKAIAGNRSNSSATSMVAASRALHALVTGVGDQNGFTLEGVLSAHQSLMNDDPREANYAGRLRDMQNWIGGSDHSPRGALYVPPAPERVAELMSDLIDYLNRDDVPVIVQAAIAHAQFESIHAFTDGNGRIGRALVSASLRRRGVTRNAVVPLASGLLAQREGYFDALTAYRRGEAGPIISLFAKSARVAAVESRDSIAAIKVLPSEWRETYRPRTGSAGAALIEAFYDHPVMSMDDIERLDLGSSSRIYAAVEDMVAVGILREITGRIRDRVWVASELIAELDDLDRRIQAGMRRR